MTIGLDDPPDPFMTPPPGSENEPLSPNEIRYRLDRLETRFGVLAALVSLLSAAGAARPLFVGRP